MRYTVHIQRVVASDWVVPIDADSEAQAIRKAMKQANHEHLNGFDTFAEQPARFTPLTVVCKQSQQFYVKNTQ